MTIKIPVVTTYDGQGLRKTKQEAAEANRQARAAYQANRREMQQNLRLERDIERAQRRQEQALRAQIAQRQRLLSLSRRLDRDLAGPAAPVVRGNIAGGVTSGLLAAGAITAAATGAADFAKRSEELGAAAAGAEARLTALLGSTERYNAVIEQAKTETRGMVTEADAAAGYEQLVDNLL